MKRNRIVYLAAMLCAMILGLLSRQYPEGLPRFVVEYAGDTLWSLAAFLGIGLFFPTWSTLRVTVGALLFSYGIELSQLYQAAWINQVRHSLLGGLILGYGFLWSDVICYTVGVGLGAVTEVLWVQAWRR